MKSITNACQKKLVHVIATELPSFQRMRYKFVEDHGDFVKIVDVAFVNIGNAEKSFSIYLGVHVPLIDKILWNKTDKITNIPATACVFDCNINEVVNQFRGKSKIKYWDLVDDDKLFLEIKTIIKAQFFPFTQKIDSLESLNDIIETLEFQTKYSATKPAMFAALKSILKKKDELEKLVKKLRSENYYAISLIDKALKI
jgi:hypothetical protein